jgi:cysteine sulfinate desulfinase/cysteine desulfurase-like protein
LAKLLLLLLLGVLSRYLQQRGWDVTYLPVEKDGRINLGQLQESIRPDTALVSVMAVNNEIGEQRQKEWGGGYLGGRGDGRINLGQLQESIRPDTALVSVMAVNNEIGETGLVFQGCGVGKGGMVCEVRQAL